MYIKGKAANRWLLYVITPTLNSFCLSISKLPYIEVQLYTTSLLLTGAGVAAEVARRGVAGVAVVGAAAGVVAGVDVGSFVERFSIGVVEAIS